MAAKQPKPVKSPLQRAIDSRQRGIDRMEENKRKIRQRAAQECAAIDKSIAAKRVLLDALRRGSLKP